jgi:hypothetical protein
VIIMTGCSLRYPSANGMIPTPTYGEEKVRSRTARVRVMG